MFISCLVKTGPTGVVDTPLASVASYIAIATLLRFFYCNSFSQNDEI